MSNELNNFEIMVLREVRDYKKNRGWIAPRNLRHSFGDNFEEKIKEALEVLLSENFILGHGSPHSDGTHGVYRITPLGKEMLRNNSSFTALNNISNSNIAVLSPGTNQSLNINTDDEDINQKLIELQQAIKEKDKIKISNVFGYILDKSVDVGIAILLKGIISC